MVIELILMENSTYNKMKFLNFVLILLFSSILSAREIGETEILTDEGIEVFQKEKYYLLKTLE